MFSRKSQAKESDVDKLFNSGKPVTYADLLKCNDLSTAYRNNNPKLIGFLLQPENIKKLLNLLIESDARSTHKTIISLFQTNNTLLHRFFADSKELSEHAYQSLNIENTKNGCYAAGTISRIESRAMDMWPIETHQVFRGSDELYSVVIKNIDQSCVYYTIQDLISSDTHPLELFIWCLFRSIVGKEFVKNELKDKRPRVCFLEKKDYNLPDFHEKCIESQDEEEKSIFKMKLLKSLELLHAYLKKKKNDHKFNDFRQFVLQYVLYVFDKKDIFIPFHLELAREAGPNKEILSKVIAKLQKLIEAQAEVKDVSSEDNLLIDRCICYLTKFTNDIKSEDFLNIAISLLDERFTQFTLLNLVEFVRRYFSQEHENIEETRKVIDNLIIYSWNVFISEDEEALKSPKSSTENRIESDCLLLQSIIFDLWKAVHLPEIKTESTKESQYADDFQKADEDDNQDFMKSQYGSSMNDDDDGNEDKQNAEKIANAAKDWLSSEVIAKHKNERFVNDIKIWFDPEYLNSVNDTEPYNSDLILTAQFENVSNKIMENVNKYRWGKKYPVLEAGQNDVEQESPKAEHNDENNGEKQHDNDENNENKNNEEEQQNNNDNENENNGEEQQNNDENNENENNEEEQQNNNNNKNENNGEEQQNNDDNNENKNNEEEQQNNNDNENENNGEEQQNNDENNENENNGEQQHNDNDEQKEEEGK